MSNIACFLYEESFHGLNSRFFLKYLGKIGLNNESTKSLRHVKLSLGSSLMHRIRKFSVNSVPCLHVVSKVKINIYKDKYYHIQLRSFLCFYPATAYTLK